MSLFSLEDRVAVVTGALGLLGRQHCHALAEAGASVIVTDLNGVACEEYAADLRTAHGVPALGIGLDVTDPVSVRKLCERALAEFHQCDVLINNAAINDMVEGDGTPAVISRFEAYPLELWRKVMEVNVTGTFLCSQALGAVMAQQQRGSIINISSTYGLVAPDQSLYRKPDGTQQFYKSPAYPASKGAVLAFTRFLASYWGSSGVRVNALCPGGVENGQERYFKENYAARTPLGRMGAAWDYKGALIFLASEASAYMTGASLVVDGGWTMW